MIDNAFRRVMPHVSGWLVRLYVYAGLRPNHVSLIGFGIGALSAAAVALSAFELAIGLWWLGRVFDGTDGILARATGRATPFGAYFDIVLDMAAYSLMILAFAVARPDLGTAWMYVLFLYVLCITSALALGAQEAAIDAPARDERGLRLGAGLAEGGETGIAYTLFLLYPQHLEPLVHGWIALLAVTVMARSVLAYRLLASR